MASGRGSANTESIAGSVGAAMCSAAELARATFMLRSLTAGPRNPLHGEASRQSCHRLAPRLEPNTSLKHSLNFSL